MLSPTTLLSLPGSSVGGAGGGGGATSVMSVPFAPSETDLERVAGQVLVRAKLDGVTVAALVKGQQIAGPSVALPGTVEADIGDVDHVALDEAGDLAVEGRGDDEVGVAVLAADEGVMAAGHDRIGMTGARRGGEQLIVGIAVDLVVAGAGLEDAGLEPGRKLVGRPARAVDHLDIELAADRGRAPGRAARIVDVGGGRAARRSVKRGLNQRGRIRGEGGGVDRAAAGRRHLAGADIDREGAALGVEPFEREAVRSAGVGDIERAGLEQRKVLAEQRPEAERPERGRENAEVEVEIADKAELALDVAVQDIIGR